MSEAKFTPGDLAACNPGDYSDFDGKSIVILGDDRRIAVVQGDDEEALAHARLFVAAPELLAACEAIIAYDNNDATDGVAMMIAYNNMITAARAAITKATKA